ncbi:MAG: carboxy-S-adenosyl-L-methionine synthase CmoA [Hahellaceae bacterium]|nr:carboxy-S-adenosyl-L-methionine synthase CmoA [Hahellaceae bacterium]
MTEPKPDNIYATPLDRVTEFAFDEAVARVFPDMIQRSVPGYTTIIPMLGVMAQRYAQPDTVCYDLGCSLGASTLAMRHGLKDKGNTIIAVDNSEAMLQRCEHYIALDNSPVPVKLVCTDIRTLEFQPASVVTLNFTLQFLPQYDRADMLTRIAEALVPGGALVLSEKICFEQTSEQSTLQELHWDFKKANGYSDLEVSQKRTALENVLIPETRQAHETRLLAAGFKQVILWYQCFNFVSFLAIK